MQLRNSILLAFLLALACTPHSDFSPQLMSYGKYSVIDTQTVAVIGGEMSSLNITHSLPHGIVGYSFPPHSEVKRDSFGNEFLTIFERRPGQQFRYVVNTTVESYRSRLTSLPQSYSPPEFSDLYLSSDSLVEASNPRIRSLALALTENSTSNFEKISRLAIYVHTLIEYDASLVGREVGATYILDNPRGVCTEYTTLYVSLARSIGIPTRYVNGYAYSDRFGSWLGHSWAESYLGQWVGVDPTWLEVGDIDATHIASVRKPTLGFSTSAVTAMVYPPTATLAFGQSGAEGALAENIRLISNSSDGTASSFSLGASSQKIPEGGKFLAWAKIDSDEYRVVGATLLPCKGEYDLLGFDGGEQFAIGSPNASTYLIWEGTVSSALPSGYRFSCPSTLNSPYLDTGAISINISTSDDLPWPVLLANIVEPNPTSGQMAGVEVGYSKALAGQKITLLTGDGMVSGTMAKGGLSFTFSAGKVGPHRVYVFAGQGDPVALDYVSAPPHGASISFLGFEHDAFSDDPNSLLFTIEQAAPSSGAMGVLEVEFAGQKAVSGTFSLSSQSINVSMPFTPGSAGSSLASVRLVSNNSILLSSSIPFTVMQSPQPELLKVLSSNAEGGRLKATFLIQRNGAEISSMTLRVGDTEVLVPQDTASISLPPGDYTGELTWQTPSGPHSSKFSFTLSAPQSSGIMGLDDFMQGASGNPKSETSTSIPSPSSLPSLGAEAFILCPVAVLFFATVFAFAFRRKK